MNYDTSTGIPADALLSVEELDQNSDLYNGYVEQTAGALGTETKYFAFAHAFDISLINPQTGEHYQPNQNVKVSIELMSEELSEGDSVNVVHFKDSSTENLAKDGDPASNASTESTEVFSLIYKYRMIEPSFTEF